MLETIFTTDDGEVALIDCMPPRDDCLDVVRLVEGRRGRVAMETEIIVRFDYGRTVPWVRQTTAGWTAVAGPDALQLVTPVGLQGVDRRTVGTFSVAAGERVPFVLSWQPANEPWKHSPEAHDAVERTEQWWRAWSDRCRAVEPWTEDVRSSLIVLKGLTYHPTGGLVAAATTSLPEAFGGERNWDYRFCWLRDATFTLIALLDAGFDEEAVAWREWLLRAVAGDPSVLQIMYGLAGERRLSEQELPWLPGYLGARPVRIGNAACEQFQLDVYGEVLDCLFQASVTGHGAPGDAWALQRSLLNFLEGAWREPDEGIWEVRGERRQFTHSKVMAWVAVDRGIAGAERFGLEGPVDRWRQLRDDIKTWILRECVDDRGVLVQHAGATELDASLLTVPLVGFLPADDPRVVATIDAIQRELTEEGFVLRYRTRESLDGLPPGEGAFLLCTFWLVDCLHLLGRTEEATALFERLLALRNDVGLLPEQIEPSTGRFLGNVPQAFSHTALVNSATALSIGHGARTRAAGT